jgi:L-lactate utilization protein LutB
VEAVSRGGALDLKFVSKSADEIKKLATRLKENLALPKPSAEERRVEQKAVAPPAQLNAALSELDRLIIQFVDDVASKGVYSLDAKTSAKARQELEAIIETSARVKKASESSGN